MSVPRLFTPAQVGTVSLKHRVVLTPLTRFRAHANHVPSDIAVAYYSQRASVPGTLLITEGTFIAAKAGGLEGVPGIWSNEQIAAWKEVCEIPFFLAYRTNDYRSRTRCTRKGPTSFVRSSPWGGRHERWTSAPETRASSTSRRRLSHSSRRRALFLAN